MAGTITSSKPTAKPYGFKTVNVTFNIPGGTWVRLRLVRNVYGYPTTQDDGTVLIDDTYANVTSPTWQYLPAGSSTPVYSDTGIVGGNYYYYSIWLQTSSGGSWVRSGDCYSLSVADHAYSDYLIGRLPGSTTSDQGEVAGQPTSTTLRHFTDLLGFSTSQTRDALDHLALLRDPNRLTGPLLPSLMRTLGWPYEPEIGLRGNRNFTRNASFLSRSKSTGQSVTGMASSLSGYGSEILPLVNQMLDQRHASFETSFSPWVVHQGSAALSVVTTPTPVDGANCLSVVPSAPGTVMLATTITPATNLCSNPSLETNATGYVSAGNVVATLAVDTSLAFAGTQSLKVTPGAGTGASGVQAPSFAVTPGTTYSVSLRVWVQAGAPAFNNAYINDNATAQVLTQLQYAGANVNGQVLPKGQWIVLTGQITPGTGATSVSPTLTLPASTTQTFWVDAVQYEVGTAPTAYTDTTRTTNQPANTYGIPVTAGSTYILSGSGQGAGTLAFDITWHDRNGRIIGFVSGTPTANSATWMRSFTQAVAPVNAVWAGVYVRLSGLTTTATYVDAIQWESNATVSPSAYTPARQVNLHLIAPRINEITNPGFDVDVANWSGAFTATRVTTPTFNGGVGAMRVDPNLNLLSADAASFETATGNWTAGTGCTLARSTAAALDGVASLAVTGTGTTTMDAFSNRSTTLAPAVTPGQVYTAVASSRAATTGRSFQVILTWLNSTGGVISEPVGATVTDNTTGWTQGFVTATAPAGAAYASVHVNYLASAVGEVHYIDTAAIMNDPTGLTTPSTRWYPGLASGQVAWDGVSNVSAINRVYLDPGNTYFVAAQINPSTSYRLGAADNTTARNYYVEVTWYSPTGAFVSTSTGPNVACPPNQWTRLTYLAPRPTASAVLYADVKIRQDASVFVPGTYYLDDCIAEPSVVVRPYFDPRSNPGDVYFDSAVGDSRSHLYPNSVTMKNRINAWLPKFLPMNTPTAITLALAPTGTSNYIDTYVPTY